MSPIRAGSSSDGSCARDRLFAVDGPAVAIVDTAVEVVTVVVVEVAGAAAAGVCPAAETAVRLRVTRLAGGPVDSWSLLVVWTSALVGGAERRTGLPLF